ncbi:hypothetical protein D920_00742 [Enterococcus faecalis 13-SD-W-01]|nr:hypothetical protein D920_00742 [Enterococcus faecalis 13-SD-W-01]
MQFHCFSPPPLQSIIFVSRKGDQKIKKLLRKKLNTAYAESKQKN